MDIFEELSLVQGKLKNKFGECEVKWGLPKLKIITLRYGTYGTGYPVSLKSLAVHRRPVWNCTFVRNCELFSFILWINRSYQYLGYCSTGSAYTLLGFFNAPCFFFYLFFTVFCLSRILPLVADFFSKSKMSPQKLINHAALLGLHSMNFVYSTAPS